MEKGIGSLPMSGSQEVDPSLFDNEIARIAKENPSEFGDSLVTGLGEIDPQLVKEFKRDLAKLKQVIVTGKQRRVYFLRT